MFIDLIMILSIGLEQNSRTIIAKEETEYLKITMYLVSYELIGILFKLSEISEKFRRAYVINKETMQPSMLQHLAAPEHSYSSTLHSELHSNTDFIMMTDIECRIYFKNRRIYEI